MHKHIRNHIHWRIKKQFESGLTQPKHLATGNLQLATRNRQLFAANAARDEAAGRTWSSCPSPPLSFLLSLSLSLPRDVSLSHTNKSQFAAACEIFSQQLRLLCILHLRNHKITPPPFPLTNPPQNHRQTHSKPIRKSTWQGHGSGSARQEQVLCNTNAPRDKLPDIFVASDFLKLQPNANAISITCRYSQQFIYFTYIEIYIYNFNFHCDFEFTFDKQLL